MSRITDLARVHEHRLLGKANVVGVGEGEDEIVVLVERKVPLEELEDEDVVDPVIDNVETDVVEIGHVRPMLAPGNSIGLKDSGTGTLGAIVRGDYGDFYVLTNNHVAADSNLARMLAPVYSPGPADGLGRVIGALARYEPIYFDRLNRVDAALVRIAGSNVPKESLIPRRVVTAGIGWSVQKHGRTTGHTWGTVLARGVTVDVDFGRQGVPRFTDQVMTTAMLEPGDSGSALLTSGGFGCGLGFAGSDTVSFHNPLITVLRTLSVRLV